MATRNCAAAGVFAAEENYLCKRCWTAGLRLQAGLALTLTLLLCFTSSSSVLAAQQKASEGSAQEQNSVSKEVDQLRKEVGELREDLKRLHALLGSRAAGSESASAPAPQPAEALQPAVAPTGVIAQAAKPAPGETGVPQYTGRSDDPRVAIATKAHGGDLSGAGNLLRTDRVTVGGYGDFQFRTPSLSERADGGGTSTFQSTRFVLGIGAVLSQKQNIVFNTEIEYELGSHEIDIEQAFIDWRVRPEFNFRGGIIVPALGRFNTYHDSNLNITTLRPLLNQFIVPTAYRDAGIGVRGVFRLPREMKLFYEADVLNGMQAHNGDGEPTPFSRLMGQSSAAEPGLIAFQATRNSKAVAGRVGFSPFLGLEFGVSSYAGKFTNAGDPEKSATTVMFDAAYQRGPFVLNGEYGRSNIVGAGVLRQSTAPPVVNPNDPQTIAALSDYVAQTTPGQDGFYVESGYKFFRGLFRNRELFDEGAYVMPVVRFETVRRDRTLSNFYLNQGRTTLGFNIAPAPSVIFKLNYILNHTFGPVPNIAGSIGGADFGNNPLPYLGYGKNGFTGSVAYVF